MGETNTFSVPHERSPLMPGQQEAGAEGEAMLHSTPADSSARDESKSSWYLFLLTVSIGGLQVVWSVELSNGSPFLLSLGMSKALLACVWIAGPLTGTIVQPYIGIRSDNCRIPWGKRKPFMVAGGAATIVSLLLLAWVKDIVGGLLSVFGVDSSSSGTKMTIMIVATIMMFCLDFAINTVQAGIRAFILDNCPTHQQELANAWASRWTGVGNIIGYIFGYMHLPKYFPFFGNTQFKVLCVFASIALGVTLAASCFYIKERDPRLDGPPPPGGLGVVAFFKQIFKSIRTLPPQIARVCEVQIAAWVGWFPFLFYATTYIGQLYVNPIFEENPHLPADQVDKAWEDATRIGTFALLIYAVISFTANTVLPIFVVPTYQPAVEVIAQQDDRDVSLDDEDERSRRISISAMPTGMASEPLLDTPSGKKMDAEKPTWLTRLQIPGLTLRRTWLLSHILFAICTFSTLFISSYQAGSIAIGFIGVSWAVTLWAPFALISAEVSRIDLERRLRRRNAASTDGHPVFAPVPNTTSNSYAPVSVEDEDDHQDDHNASADDLEEGRSKASADADSDNLIQAGIVLGLHNVAISFPQIFSSLICSAIFKAAQKPRGEPWDDSVGWVLRFGGCAALVAALLTKRLAEGTR
ncbi:hypothetical protein N7466_000363 [Penicillium verhagenii]|uniref:uncharacterized protein n=1 Tax=Penicillium verhagenii TaxID=1562060 RepID=UPI002544FE61|nr:uncharacterized protein N7466_000363 [Penicillium verhagenii]KAJ5947348.1 hypothetical protein N7466_000363 [Penicillium verhagenii]